MTALPFTPAPDLAETIRQAAVAERDHRNAVAAPQARAERRRRAGDQLDAANALAGSLGCEAGFVLGLVP